MKKKVNPERDSENYCDRMIGAVRAGDIEDVELLLNNNSNLSKVDERKDKEPSVLEIALNNRDDVIATMLCEAGAKIDLISEEKQQQFEMTINQVYKRINENIIKKDNFIKAVCSGDIDAATGYVTKNQSLACCTIKKGTEDEMSVLELVVGLGNCAMAKLLMNNNANPNQALMNGNGGLLHLAARKGNKSIYDLLVKEGADQTFLDNDGKKASEIRFMGPIDWRGMIEERRAQVRDASQTCAMM